jgi:hypothetical protein
MLSLHMGSSPCGWVTAKVHKSDDYVLNVDWVTAAWVTTEVLESNDYVVASEGVTAVWVYATCRRATTMLSLWMGSSP